MMSSSIPVAKDDEGIIGCPQKESKLNDSAQTTKLHTHKLNQQQQKIDELEISNKAKDDRIRELEKVLEGKTGVALEEENKVLRSEVEKKEDEISRLKKENAALEATLTSGDQQIASSPARVRAVEKVAWVQQKHPLGQKEAELLYAAKNGDLHNLMTILANCTNVNAASNTDGTTALMWVSQKGSLHAVEELIVKGADINAARTSDGATALILAAQCGELEAVQALLSYGANINAARTSEGATALMMAVQNQDFTMIEELINNGANVNAARTSDGTTVLMVASKGGSIEIVRQLVTAGARVDAANSSGKIAASIARENGHSHILEYLQELGASW